MAVKLITSLILVILAQLIQKSKSTIISKAIQTDLKPSTCISAQDDQTKIVYMLNDLLDKPQAYNYQALAVSMWFYYNTDSPTQAGIFGLSHDSTLAFASSRSVLQFTINLQSQTSTKQLLFESSYFSKSIGFSYSELAADANSFKNVWRKAIIVYQPNKKKAYFRIQDQNKLKSKDLQIDFSDLIEYFIHYQSEDPTTVNSNVWLNLDHGTQDPTYTNSCSKQKYAMFYYSNDETFSIDHIQNLYFDYYYSYQAYTPFYYFPFKIYLENSIDNNSLTLKSIKNIYMPNDSEAIFSSVSLIQDTSNKQLYLTKISPGQVISFALIEATYQFVASFILEYGTLTNGFTLIQSDTQFSVQAVPSQGKNILQVLLNKQVQQQNWELGQSGSVHTIQVKYGSTLEEIVISYFVDGQPINKFTYTFNLQPFSSFQIGSSTIPQNQPLDQDYFQIQDFYLFPNADAKQKSDYTNEKEFQIDNCNLYAQFNYNSAYCLKCQTGYVYQYSGSCASDQGGQSNSLIKRQKLFFGSSVTHIVENSSNPQTQQLTYFYQRQDNNFDFLIIGYFQLQQWDVNQKKTSLINLQVSQTSLYYFLNLYLESDTQVTLKMTLDSANLICTVSVNYLTSLQNQWVQFGVGYQTASSSAYLVYQDIHSRLILQQQTLKCNGNKPVGSDVKQFTVCLGCLIPNPNLYSQFIGQIKKVKFLEQFTDYQNIGSYVYDDTQTIDYASTNIQYQTINSLLDLLSLSLPGLSFSCQTGYYLFEGVCVKSCNSITRQSQQSQLLGQYNALYQDESSCEMCPQNCLSCTSQDVCTSCILGYVLDGNSSCKPCELSNFYDTVSQQCKTICPKITDQLNRICIQQPDTYVHQSLPMLDMQWTTNYDKFQIISSNTHQNTLIKCTIGISYQFFNFYGGYDLTSSESIFIKQTNLPNNYSKVVTFNVVIFDDSTSDSSIQVTLNGQKLTSTIFTIIQKGTNICNSNDNTQTQTIAFVQYEVIDNSNTLALVIQPAAGKVGLAIRNINLTVKKCHSSCFSCQGGPNPWNCIFCQSKNNIRVDSQCICQQGEYYKYQGCYSSPCYDCVKCTQSDCQVCEDETGDCSLCNQGFILQEGKCVQACDVKQQYYKYDTLSVCYKQFNFAFDSFQQNKIVSNLEFWSESTDYLAQGKPLLSCLNQLMLPNLGNNTNVAEYINLNIINPKFKNNYYRGFQFLFNLTIIDNIIQDTDFIKFEYLGTNYITKSFNNTKSSNSCVNPSYGDSIQQLNLNVYSGSSQIDLKISSNFQSDKVNASFSIAGLLVNFIINEPLCNSYSYLPNFTNSTCQGCIQNANLQKGKCICAQGFYFKYIPKIFDGICLPCNSACRSCTGPSVYSCITCESGYFYDGQRCIKSCLEGFYRNSTNYCVPCHQNCFGCTGPEENQCTSCQIGKFYYFNKCYSNCVTANELSVPDDWTRSCIILDNQPGPILFSTPDFFNQSTFQDYAVSIGLDQNSIYQCGSFQMLGLYGQQMSMVISKIKPHSVLKFEFKFYLNINCELGCLLATKIQDYPTTENQFTIISKKVACSSSSLLSQQVIFKDTKTEESSYTFIIQVQGSEFAVSSFQITPITCHVSCKYCEGPLSNQCTDCQEGSMIQGNNSVGSCVCKDETQGLGLSTAICSDPLGCMTCQQCLIPCLSCYKNDPLSCLTCAQGKALFKSTCVDSCPPDISVPALDSNKNNICSPCKLPCLTCDLKFRCTSCISEYIFIADQLTCATTCPDGYFKPSDDSTSCERCGDICKTCSQSKNNCLSCNEGYYFTEDPILGNQCNLCDSRCQSCKGPSNTQCIGCSTQPGVVKFNPSGTEYCSNTCDEEPGYYMGYDQSQTLKCISCAPNCSSCNSLNPDSCTSCFQGYTIMEGICAACDSSCYNCNGITKYNCIQCSNELNLLNNQCVQQCPEGYFSQSQIVLGVKLNTCIKCPSSCSSCTSLTSCNLCNLGYYLSNNQCLTCQNNCQICFGDNGSLCQRCYLGYFLQNQKCLKKCESVNGIGFYGEISTKTCLQCDLSCQTCINKFSYTCTKCFDGFYLYSPKGKDSTPQQDIFGTCFNCPKESKTCIFEDNLVKSTSCKAGYYLYSSQCLPNCPNNTFANTQTNICVQCNSACQQCQDITINNCSVCSKGYVLDLTSCLPCSAFLDNCLDCSSQTNCQKCQDGLILYDGKCISSCDASKGLYQENQQCKPCVSPCIQCTSAQICQQCAEKFIISGTQCVSCDIQCQTCNGTSADNCTSCPQGFYLQQISVGKAKCTLNCLSGYYQNKQLGACVQCDVSCSECQDSTSCTSCSDGYYQVSNKPLCSQCKSTCSSCTDLNVCKSCQQGYFLSNNDCVPICPKGQYGSSGLCLPCDSNCSTCSSTPKNCLSCQIGYYLNSSNVCIQCSQNCLECKSPSECLNCSFGTFLEDGICKTSCSNPNSYQDQSLNKCIVCDSSCKTCNGSSSRNCLTCKPGYYFSILNSPSGICIQCDNSCEICTGPSNDECQSCKKGVQQKPPSSCIACPVSQYFDGSQCQICSNLCLTCFNSSANSCLSCKQNYFLDVNTNTCQSCPQTCQTCASSTYCTACEPGFFLLNHLLCVTKCPVGMRADAISGVCMCDITCSKCTHNITQNTTTCQKCINSDYLLNGDDPVCIDASSCQGFKDLINGSCVQKCPLQAAYIDLDAKSCSNNPCQTNQFIQKINDILYCSVSCLPSYYKEMQTKFCLPCDYKCQTCNGPLDNQCQLCSNNNYYHPDIQTCKDSCLPGYNQLDQTQNVCTPCIKNCKFCISSLILFEGNCISQCPVGYQKVNQSCEYAPVAVVKISNVSNGQVISINVDFEVQSTLQTSSQVENIVWSVTKSLDKKFQTDFSSISSGSLSQVIPYLILTPANNFILQVAVTLKDGTVISDNVNLLTSDVMHEGQFVVDKTQGISFKDTFLFSINNWSFTEQLYYDLNFYELAGIQQVNISSNSNTQIDFQKDELFQLYEQVALNSIETISYQFQPFSTEVNIVCELKVYTKENNVQSFKYILIKLKEYDGKKKEIKLLNDNLDQIGSTSDLNKLHQFIFRYSFVLKYMVDKDQEKRQKLSQQINLRQVALLSGISNSDLPSCDNDIDCFSSGQCSNNPLYQQSCFCSSGYYGINCEYNKQQYEIITKSFDKITNLLNTLKLSAIIKFQIIENLTYYFDIYYLNFSQLETLINIQQSIINQYLSVTLDQVKGQILQRGLSLLTNQVKQMKQDATSLINIGYNLQNKVSSNLNVGEKLLTASDASDSVSYPYLLQKLSSNQSKQRMLKRLRLLSEDSNTGLPVVFGSLTVQFPPEVIQTNKKQVIQATSWKSNPRSNPFAVTQCISLSISSGGEEKPINNLSQPITITIPKSIPSPVSSDSSSISCTYYDEATNSWKSDGCTFVKETILNIICSCTHLTDFTGQKAQVQASASIKLTDITKTVTLGNSMLQQSANQKVVINQLPVLQIGQRSVNLVNQLNILQSGSALNLVKKNTIILIENQYYSEDISEFWEQDYVTIKNDNNEQQQEVAEGQIINNLQIIFYFLIAFNISFFLVMRAHFKFNYIKIDFKQIKLFELKQNKMANQAESETKVENKTEIKKRKNLKKFTNFAQSQLFKTKNRLQQRRTIYVQNQQTQKKQESIEKISEDNQKQLKQTLQTSILSIEDDSQNQINHALSQQYNLPSVKSINFMQQQAQLNQIKHPSITSLDEDIENQRKQENLRSNDSSRELSSYSYTPSNRRVSRFNTVRRDGESEKLITIIDEDEELEINTENDEQNKLNNQGKRPTITKKPNKEEKKKQFHSMQTFVVKNPDQGYENHIQDLKEQSINPREQSLKNVQKVSKLIKKLKRNYEMLNGNDSPSSFSDTEVQQIQNRLAQQKKILVDQETKNKKILDSKDKNFQESLEQKISQNKGFKFLSSIQKQEEAEEQLIIVKKYQEILQEMIKEKNFLTENIYKIENNETLILIEEEIKLPFSIQQMLEVKKIIDSNSEQQNMNKIKKNSKKNLQMLEATKLSEMEFVLNRINQEIDSKERFITLMKGIINQYLQINSLSIFQLFSLCTYQDRLFSNRQTKSIYFSCQLILAIFTNIIFNESLNQYFSIDTQFGLFELYLYRILVTVAISHSIPYFFFGLITNIFASSSKRINQVQPLDFKIINSLRKDFMIYYIALGSLQMASCLGGIYFYSLNSSLLNSFSLSYHIVEVFISILISGVFIDGIFFLIYLYGLSNQERLEDGFLNKILACRGFYYYKGYDSLEIYKQYFLSIIMEEY